MGPVPGAVGRYGDVVLEVPEREVGSGVTIRCWYVRFGGRVVASSIPPALAGRSVR